MLTSSDAAELKLMLNSKPIGYFEYTQMCWSFMGSQTPELQDIVGVLL